MRSRLALWAIPERSTKVFRVTLAIWAILDLLGKGRWLEAFYAETGLEPSSVALAAWPYPGWELIHGAVAALPAVLPFVVGVAAAIGMMLGWQARVMAFVAWVVVVYVQRRNGLVLHTGDDLLRMLLLISVFLPGRGAAGLLLTLQVAAVFVVGALQKDFAAYVVRGDAVEAALRLEQVARPWTLGFLEYPAMLQWMSRYTWFAELLGGLLLLVPHARARWVAMVLLAPLMVGILVAMDVGLFPFGGLVALSAFVPRKHNETGEKDCPLAVGALVLATVAVPVLRRVGVEPYPLSASLGLDQGWAMFAPAPSRIDGWYLVVGQKPDGSLVDVWRGRETLDTAKPDDMPAYFGSYLWRRLFTHLHDGKRGRTFEAAIPYFCRRWQGPLTAVAIEFKYEPTHVGAKDGPIESVPLFRGECPAR